MKLLLLTLVVGLVSSLPRRDRKPKEEMEENKKADPRFIIRCFAENWEYKNGTEEIDEQAIQDCRSCFQSMGNPRDEDSLPQAKECVAQYLPKGHASCKSEIEAFQSWDEDKLKKVFECFDDTLERVNKEKCLNQATNTVNIEKITDATMCVMESWKYKMAYVKKLMMDKGGKGKGPRKGKKREEKGGKKAMIMTLLTKAHCDLDSRGNATESSDCFKCFSDAEKNSMGKGGRRKKEMSPDMSPELACAEHFLDRSHKKCNEMMRNKADKKETHKCYMRVLIKNEVGKCSGAYGSVPIGKITPKVLTNVLECGKENVKAFVKQNASMFYRPEEAKRMADFLDDDDEDDDDMEG